jgi:hypothetical protein
LYGRNRKTRRAEEGGIKHSKVVDYKKYEGRSRE